MADKVEMNNTTKGVLGKAKEKIGHFTTGTGGGEPIPAGHKWTTEKRVSDQPRDEKGQFTYNSMNGKGLKYESRGTTVPPILRDVELTFIVPGTKLKVDEQNIYMATVEYSIEDLVANMKEWNEKEKGFAGMGEGTSVKKMGRKSKAEKEADEGIAGYVDPKTLSQGTQDKMDEAAKKHAEEESGNRKSEYDVGGFHVKDDTWNPEEKTSKKITDERYWEYLLDKELEKLEEMESKGDKGFSGFESLFAPSDKTFGDDEDKDTTVDEDDKVKVGAGAPSESEKASKLFGVDVKEDKPAEKEEAPKEEAPKEFDIQKAKDDPKGFLKEIGVSKVKDYIDKYNEKHVGKKQMDLATFVMLVRAGKIKHI